MSESGTNKRQRRNGAKGRNQWNENISQSEPFPSKSCEVTKVQTGVDNMKLEQSTRDTSTSRLNPDAAVFNFQHPGFTEKSSDASTEHVGTQEKGNNVSRERDGKPFLAIQTGHPGGGRPAFSNNNRQNYKGKKNNSVDSSRRKENDARSENEEQGAPYKNRRNEGGYEGTDSANQVCDENKVQPNLEQAGGSDNNDSNHRNNETEKTVNQYGNQNRHHNFNEASHADYRGKGRGSNFYKKESIKKESVENTNEGQVFNDQTIENRVSEQPSEQPHSRSTGRVGGHFPNNRGNNYGNRRNDRNFYDNRGNGRNYFDNRGNYRNYSDNRGNDRNYSDNRGNDRNNSDNHGNDTYYPDNRGNDGNFRGKRGNQRNQHDNRGNWNNQNNRRSDPNRQFTQQSSNYTKENNAELEENQIESVNAEGLESCSNDNQNMMANDLSLEPSEVEEKSENVVNISENDVKECWDEAVEAEEKTEKADNNELFKHVEKNPKNFKQDTKTSKFNDKDLYQSDWGNDYDPSWNADHSANTSTKTSNYKNVTKQVFDKDRKKSDDFDFYDRKIRRADMDHKRVVEVEGDLFSAGEEYSMAHCVAEDMNMGSGIALMFRTTFKRVEELLNQGVKQGDVGILDHEGRFIYYLVTKRESNKKPTLNTMYRSLIKLKEHMVENGVKKLAIPRIGCGLDRLEWKEVKNMIEFIFQDTDVEIKVFNFQKAVEQMQDKRTDHRYRKCPVTTLYKTMKDYHTSSYAMVLYLGSEQGDVTPQIKAIDERFDILRDYRLATKTIGEFTCTYKQNQKYCLVRIIVKKKWEDEFDFASFKKAIFDLNKMNDKAKKTGEQYEELVMHQYEEKNDDIFMNKITNVMRNTLHNVHIGFLDL